MRGRAAAGGAPCQGAARCRPARGLRLSPGARLVFRDGTPDILAFATDRPAWGRLLPAPEPGQSAGSEGSCLLDEADLLQWGEG